MTQHRMDTNGDLAEVDTTYERLDLRRRDIVDHAILVQQSSNTVSAIEYLKSHDIDARLIERVLLEPQRRRRSVRHMS
jgi:hypothetical protein